MSSSLTARDQSNDTNAIQFYSNCESVAVVPVELQGKTDGKPLSNEHSLLNQLLEADGIVRSRNPTPEEAHIEKKDTVASTRNDEPFQPA